MNTWDDQKRLLPTKISKNAQNFCFDYPKMKFTKITYTLKKDQRNAEHTVRGKIGYAKALWKVSNARSHIQHCLKLNKFIALLRIIYASTVFFGSNIQPHFPLLRDSGVTDSEIQRVTGNNSPKLRDILKQNANRPIEMISKSWRPL